jgi:hypothetical protein
MVSRELNSRLVKLLVLNFSLVLLLVITASALSGYTENLREQAVSSQIKVLENRIYEIETMERDDELLEYKILNLIPLVSRANYDLKNYAHQKMVSQEFYEKNDEKLVSLSILYMKTVREVLRDKLIIQFFCVYDNAACDYENFVLSYITKKYSGQFLIMYFDGESSHPLVRMVRDKYGVEEFPFMLLDDEVVDGFRSAEELEEMILEHVNNGFEA